jgi:hypothetical protein
MSPGAGGFPSPTLVIGLNGATGSSFDSSSDSSGFMPIIQSSVPQQQPRPSASSFPTIITSEQQQQQQTSTNSQLSGIELGAQGGGFHIATQDGTESKTGHVKSSSNNLTESIISNTNSTTIHSIVTSSSQTADANRWIPSEVDDEN